MKMKEDTRHENNYLPGTKDHRRHAAGASHQKLIYAAEKPIP